MDETFSLGEGPAPTGSGPHDQTTDSCSPDQLVDIVTSLFDLPFDQGERVEAVCAQLKPILAARPNEPDSDAIRQLAALLKKRAGPIAKPVFDLLAGVATRSSHPWPVLAVMLAAKDADLVRRARDLTRQLARSGALVVNRDVASILADRVDINGSVPGESEDLKCIAQILCHLDSTESRTDGDQLRDLYVSGGTVALRSLAARLLDLDGQPAAGELAKLLLGPENYRGLAPYLAYTRASHLDVLHLALVPSLAHTTLPSLRLAQTICGDGLLCKAIAELGWARMNLGLDVQRRLGISVNGSLPFMVTSAEASLFAGSEEARPARDAFLFVAHGGLPYAPSTGGEGEDQVARFRTYNLAHAELLALILNLAPLTRDRVQEIVKRMDRIVEDFTALFAALSEECTILPGLYRELRGRIVAEMELQGRQPQLSPELSRLVQMFEDPRTLGDVRTLHGLKRYLHQRGLKLGFRLVGRSQATNRTVDLVLASRRRLLSTVRRIRFIDYESAEERADQGVTIPYPVAVVIDGFARQLFYGQEDFPQVDTYCYGNEVHYYIAFRNHPAFLRIDYSPPLRGGMIDLEYYGVSKYELPAHPDISLKAIRLFFRHLEFEVQVENTHIHARYDKERALNLGDLCQKAEAIFRLVPYLMDVDWIIGSLNLDREAQRVVAEAWAGSFAHWGVLPLRELLTRDKTGIRMAPEIGASAADGETAWSGRGPYTDRFNTQAAVDLYASVLARLGSLGLDLLSPLELEDSRMVGQLGLERLVLVPMREAVARGEITATPRAFQARSTELFWREHEAERFAEILASPDETAAAARLAALVAPLERTMRFRTTGHINGYEVQRGGLALRGESISLFVLRDARGVTRLALFARDRALYRRRERPVESWRSNGSCNSVELAALLLRNNYLTSGVEPLGEATETSAEAIAAQFQLPNPTRRRRALPGETAIAGLGASPGRAVGRAVLGTEGRAPEDCTAAVLIAPTVRPQDNAFLYQAAGVVSTGGGILSHTGLVAAQFRKPALIIQGQWQSADDGSLTLLYRTSDYSEENREICGFAVSLYQHLHDKEHRLQEGDLVILDADEGVLRILGHDRDALALHEGIRQFGAASVFLTQAQDTTEILVLRGRRLQARHLIEKLLARLSDPALAYHALDELLLGEYLSGRGGGRSERARLLRLLLDNPLVGTAARARLREIVDDLDKQCRAVCDKAQRLITTAETPYEILLLRLQALRLDQTAANVACSLADCGFAVSQETTHDTATIDAAARTRLAELRARYVQKVIPAPEQPETVVPSRHLIRQIERLDLVLGDQSADTDVWKRRQELLSQTDHNTKSILNDRLTLTAADGGFELSSFVGWKAANLAEIERLGGRGLVPAWFVVTDCAFRQMLDSPAGPALAELDSTAPRDATLREAIARILALPHADYEAISQWIGHLWQKATLPRELAEEIIAAYSSLAVTDQVAGPEPDGGSPFVAIRSSTREEDAEATARAGEFDTFLFIRGASAMLEYIRRAWSGLWTARAIQNRALFGTDPTETGGGVIVQRMVRSRVAGVLHTVNMAGGEPREILINAGLGLGEGIVSGTVPADHIVVAKEGDPERSPLRFRYTTADKLAQVVLDARTGLGTRRAETLYHQRFRPALEYVELCELVRTAVRLETAYGYPLDIEFGIEGTKVWILQARPVPTYLAVLRETAENWPLHRPAPSG